MEKDRISIIIPIYNAEKYLEPCLDSIINQTYKELEIICVNDGSIDKSISILESYTKKDDRIKIYSKENGGLSDARNFGLEKSTGEYIYFLDADDYISEYYIEGLYNAIKDTDADFAYNDNVINVYDKKKVKSTRKLKRKEGSYSDLAHIWDTLRTSVWTKMYRRSFLDKYNLRFIKGLWFEDHLFKSQIKLHTKNIAVSTQGNHFYRRVGSSFSNTYYDTDEIKTTFDEITIYKQMIDYRKIHNGLNQIETFYWLAKHFARTSPNNQRNFFNELKELFLSFNQDFLTSRSKKELKFYDLVINSSFEETLSFVNSKNNKRIFLNKLRLKLIGA